MLREGPSTRNTWSWFNMTSTSHEIDLTIPTNYVVVWQPWCFISFSESHFHARAKYLQIDFIAFVKRVSPNFLMFNIFSHLIKLPRLGLKEPLLDTSLFDEKAQFHVTTILLACMCEIRVSLRMSLTTRSNLIDLQCKSCRFCYFIV